MFSMKTCHAYHPVGVQIESTSWKGVWWCDGGRYWEQIWLRVWEWVIEAGSFSIREPPWQLSLHGHTKAMPNTCLISSDDLVKEFPLTVHQRIELLWTCQKITKDVIFSKTAPGIIIMAEALLLLYDLVATHWPSMMFSIFLQIPSRWSEKGAVDVKEQKLNNDCCAESGRKTIIYSHSAFFCH